MKSIRHTLILVAVISVSYTNVFSHDSLKTGKVSIWNNIVNDIEISAKDGVSFYTAPLRFNGRDWLYSGCILAGLGSTILIDDKLKERLSTGEKKNDFWFYIKNYGEIKYAGAGSLLVYFAGLAAQQDEVRVLGRMLLQSLFYSSSLTMLIKYIAGRSRPFYSDSQYDFNWFETKEEKTSFPSLHSTVAFALSSVFAEKINTWWSRAGFYSLAALVSYSRIHDNQHWVSDTFLGGLIGFGAGYFVVHSHNSGTKSKVSIFPSPEGLNFQYRL